MQFSPSKRTQSTAIGKTLPHLNSPSPSLHTNKESRPFPSSSKTSICCPRKELPAFRTRMLTEGPITNRVRTQGIDQGTTNLHRPSQLQAEVDGVLELFRAINRLREQYGVI